MNPPSPKGFAPVYLWIITATLTASELHNKTKKNTSRVVIFSVRYRLGESANLDYTVCIKRQTQTASFCMPKPLDI